MESGGLLERPATKFSSVFGRFEFLHHYPYALPGIATSIIAVSAAVLVLLFVKEVCTMFPFHYTS
jgi:hypothetical protein